MQINQSNNLNNSQTSKISNKNEDQICINEPKKVEVYLFYEVLCSTCVLYIIDELNKFIVRIKSNKSNQYLFISGPNAKTILLSLLERNGYTYFTIDFNDILNNNYATMYYDFFIVNVHSIPQIIPHIDTIKYLQQYNIVFYCNETHNCPKSCGALFNAVFKKLTFK